MSNLENILAVASAPANGAVGLIRLSGPDVLKVLESVFSSPITKPIQFKPRYMYYGQILSKSDEVLDEVMAVYFKGPSSFTGEDVVEIHTHGNLILLERLVRQILDYNFKFGLRLAEPGEFTKRAFLNGKMDLTQAEAIHDLITAESESSLKANLKNLSGVLSQEIKVLKDNLTSSLALVEASFEFPEEDIQTYDENAVLSHLKTALEKLLSLKDAFQSSQIMDQGVSVALVGMPNVGKSSLLNALLQEEKAIVTDIAGTTRDIVEGSRQIAGVRFYFRDTAGMRETTDKVESIGIQKSQQCLENSDIVLHIFDSIDDLPILKIKKSQNYIRILNKWDELQDEHHITDVESKFDIVMSVKNHFNLDSLLKMLENQLKSTKSVQNNVHINSRQYQQIHKSIEILEGVMLNYSSIQGSEEILAEELRHIVSHLDEITGQVHSEDILGEIFQRFCIGK